MNIEGIEMVGEYKFNMGIIKKFKTPKNLQLSNEEYSSSQIHQNIDSIVLGHSGRRSNFNGTETTMRIAPREEMKNIGINHLKWIQEILNNNKYNTITKRVFADHNNHYNTSGGFDVGQIVESYTVMFCFGSRRSLNVTRNRKDAEIIGLEDNTFIVIPEKMERLYDFEIPDPNKGKKSKIEIGSSVHILIRAFD